MTTPLYAKEVEFLLQETIAAFKEMMDSMGPPTDAYRLVKAVGTCLVTTAKLNERIQREIIDSRLKDMGK